MPTQTTSAASATKDAIIAETVRLLNTGGVGAVTCDELCRLLGLEMSTFTACFRSEREVFGELVQRVTGSHGSGVSAITRRRSLTELLTTVTMSFLDVLERYPAEHQAFMCLRIAEISTPGLVALPGPEMSLHEHLMANSQRWLDAVELTQEIAWDRPIVELATMQIGATDALVLDFLIRHDRSAAEFAIRASAYNLGTYGRRRFKNGKK